MKLERGAILQVDFDPTLGHEQRGLRPAVLVSDPAVIAPTSAFRCCASCRSPRRRARELCIRNWSREPAGLKRSSYAMVDQLRSVDKQRVRRVYGRLTDEELAAIDDGLRLYLAL